LTDGEGALGRGGGVLALFGKDSEAVLTLGKDGEGGLARFGEDGEGGFLAFG
jgi:hypothetical protein